MSLRSRNRLNLVLLTAVVMLGLLAHFKPGLQHAAAGAPLLADPGKVREIRIALAGQPEVNFTRDGQMWRMQAPLQWPADAALVQDFLDSLTEPVAPGFPAAGADLGQYNLDKPLARFWLDGVEYDLGGAQPVSKQRYLLSGGKVVLVEGYVFYRIAHDAFGWLDHRPLPDGARILSLQLPHATLIQDAKGDWQLAPADKNMSQEALRKFAGGWQDAIAIGMAAIGKGKPEGEVAVELAGIKQPLRFQILDDPDYLVLARPDLGFEYHFDISERDLLLSPAPAAAAH